jgi:acid phosphatase
MKTPAILLAAFLALPVAFAPGDDAPPAPGKDVVLPWPDGLPVYDHVVLVIEENKDFGQIVGRPDLAPYINDTLCKEGACFTQMYGEEHHSQGNYFWLFSGSNHNVGFDDHVPTELIKARNLGASLLAKGLSFKGYSEDLAAVGFEGNLAPQQAPAYARKHVPWVSFENVPNGATVARSSNLRFRDFPRDPDGFRSLPTVAFVIPNLQNDMHDGELEASIRRGDAWLKNNLDDYYRWAKNNNSLLVVTFDENDDRTAGLTDPFATPPVPGGKDKRNQICTVFAGARIKPGRYDEGKGITHVNVLRTLESMYGLPKAGKQQKFAEQGGIGDDYLITDVFSR